MLKARPTDRPPVKKNNNYTFKAKKKNSIFNFAGNLIKKNILSVSCNHEEVWFSNFSLFFCMPSLFSSTEIIY